MTEICPLRLNTSHPYMTLLLCIRLSWYPVFRLHGFNETRKFALFPFEKKWTTVRLKMQTITYRDVNIMTKLSPTEVVKQVKDLSKPTLYRMMENGEISYEGKDRKRLIDVSEVIRVFGDKFNPESSKKINDTSQDVKLIHNDTSDNVSLLHYKISVLEEKLETTAQERERERNTLKQQLRDAQSRESELMDIVKKEQERGGRIEKQLLTYQEEPQKKRRLFGLLPA